MNQYQRQKSEDRQFIEALGRTWACDDCGVTDKPVSFFLAGPPMTETEVQTMASFDPEWSELAYRQSLIARSPLLCVKCRHSRERVARRVAAVMAVGDGASCR